MTETAAQLLYSRDPAVLSATLGGEEIALLDAARENYFGLEGPGSRIWQLLEQPRTISDICATLLSEYEIDATACEQQTRQFVEELAARRLVTAKPSP